MRIGEEVRVSTPVSRASERAKPATLQVDQEEHPVEAGAVIFVKAGVNHRLPSR